MCDLLRQNHRYENMLILKMHGGTTNEDVYNIVRKGIDCAKRNFARGIHATVVFFDEANTTEAIASVKSVLCDRLVDGEVIPSDIGLQFVAAVNPYREHTQEMIDKLENAGLGYHIRAENTADTIGGIPLRRLVYRVKEIPASLFPLIWDFGTLDQKSEKRYIIQMVSKSLQEAAEDREVNLVVDVLLQSQKYMRSRKDECSFVSLRDVERTLLILNWFLKKDNLLEAVLEKVTDLPEFEVALILSLGVSYWARLEDRRKYVSDVSKVLDVEPKVFQDVIVACQTTLIDQVRLEQTIAKNEALMENVFMMVICIELRIPLFLVGKPGSSKSLAKTIVTDVMQGSNSPSPLFHSFKEVHMVSFQCSPLATDGGILSTFKQCQKYQEKRKQELRDFTAVCVLDEVGLAEDSPKMPLKVLHPLLEDGCVGDEVRKDWSKVSFIGISNWALDPAKMNRGILLSRGEPSQRDLIKIAEGNEHYIKWSTLFFAKLSLLL